VPTLAHQLHTPADAHEDALSVACAVVLLLVFIASIPVSIKGGPSTIPSHKAADAHGWPLWLVALSWCWPAWRGVRLGLVCSSNGAGDSDSAYLGAFTGLVVVAIAGNAVENVVGIQLAAATSPITRSA